MEGPGADVTDADRPSVVSNTIADYADAAQIRVAASYINRRRLCISERASPRCVIVVEQHIAKP